MKNDLSFKTQSYNQNYYIQIQLFDFLFDKLKNNPDSNFYKKFLLEISDKYLQIYFEDSKTGVRDKNMVVFSEVYIYPTENIRKLRSKIWEFLLTEFYNFEEESYEILSNYINQTFTSSSRYKEKNKKDIPARQIAEFDKEYILKFFENILRGENYLHCKIFDVFYDKCKDDGIDYSHLKKRFTNRVFEVSLILNWDFFKFKRSHDIETRDELKEFKKHEIQSYFRNFKYKDYIQLFEDISFLLSVESGHSYRFQNSLEIIFLQLAELDIELLLSILKHIIANKNQLDFYSYKVINILVNNSKYKPLDIYDLIAEGEYKFKSFWLQLFFQCLEEKAVNDYFYSKLIEMYKTWDDNLHVSFDFIQKFKKCDEKIFITVFNILLNKAKTSNFRLDFSYWTLFEQFINEFEKDFECLKALYLYKEQTEKDFDFDKKYLNRLVEIDNDFLFVILKLIYSKNNYFSPRHENYRFEFLWDYDNFEYLIEKSIELYNNKDSVGANIINIIFPVNTTIKVTDFIRKFIVKYHNDIKKIEIIFNVITYTYPSQRIYYLSILLNNIKNVETIKSLELIQSFKSGRSLIPLYEADRKFWKDFEEILSQNVKHLKLKLWTKQEQIGCEKRIEWQRKRDFIDDF